jgi:hypothetical protein
MADSGGLRTLARLAMYGAAGPTILGMSMSFDRL